MDNKEEFLERLAEILDVDRSDLEQSYELEKSGNWDSLGHVSTAALVNEMYDVEIEGERLIESRTVNDLLSAVEDARA